MARYHTFMQWYGIGLSVLWFVCCAWFILQNWVFDRNQGGDYATMWAARWFVILLVLVALAIIYALIAFIHHVGVH